MIPNRLTWCCLILGLGVSARAAPAFPPDAVVAADGSGQYRTVHEAIDAAPQITHDSGRRWRILVKQGIYREMVYIQREKRFLCLIGADAEKTVVTFNLSDKNYKDPSGVYMPAYRTATVMLDADDFTIENMTFENSAGRPGAAYALRVDGERDVFHHCRFLGWGDTAFLCRGRQYFEDCTFVGAVDFIFGGATAFFERCRILCAGTGCLSAASTPDDQPFGFVFSDCIVAGSQPGVRTWLGRPWRDYGQTIFLNTEMSEVVRPAGWSDWNKPWAQKTARFAEFNSTGPGAGKPGERVPWVKILTAQEASRYRVDKVLGGADGWNPQKP